MYKLFGRALLPLLLLLLLPCAAHAAEYDGYIVRIEPAVSLLSEGDGLPVGVEEIYASEGLYKVEDPAMVEELADAGLLVYAEPDYLIELETVPDDPALAGGKQWGLSLVGMEYAWNHGITGASPSGERVRVGIVDSGLYADHEDLAGTAVVPGTNYCVKEGAAARGDTTDNVGHGTFVAGVIAAATGNGTGIAGMAPDVEIVPLKCFDGQTGSISNIVAAIYGGVDGYRCQVLNLSFGTTAEKAGQSLRDAIAHAAEQGVLMAAAVGNVAAPGVSTGSDPLLYPAAYDTVAGVGAVDADKRVSSFSYQNAGVWITAPGEEVYGLSNTSAGAYKSGSGTSYATPMVTAAAALALSVKPDLTCAEWMELLRSTAEDLGEPGYDFAYGYGLLRIDRLLAELRSMWFVSETEEGLQLTTRREEVTPGSTVLAATVVYGASGKQLSVSLAELTAAEDGSLTVRLELPAEGEPDAVRMCVLLLQSGALAPLGRHWERLLC